MILFNHRGCGFVVYRTATDWPKRLSDRTCALDRIGEIDQISDEWVIGFGNPPCGYLDVDSILDNGEKRQIIGMLDSLNDVTGREEATYLARWNEIIGLPTPKVWTQIVVEDYRANNPWSDTVAKIEAARADNTLA